MMMIIIVTIMRILNIYDYLEVVCVTIICCHILFIPEVVFIDIIYTNTT
jgi:hypothetical protein